ncbi:hypothetical protein WJX73_004903 [Symbiochloris irregularis]|uniref:dCMP deaminase n=1 Tax=Symbiochloris irregularis TaxID=706552 RepID=A0AAW1NUG5_9CHLO
MQNAGFAASDNTLLDLLLLSLGIALGATVTAGLLLRAQAGSAQRLEKATKEVLTSVKQGSTIEPAPKADPFETAPRSGYLTWEEYFMAVACLSAQRSKDPNKQVGACIVSQDNIILGIGYNGFPRGCSDTKLPWSKLSPQGNLLETKYPYVCHAELNAVLNKNAATLRGARLFVTMFPCNECAKLLIQAGILEVVYREGKGLDAEIDKPGPTIGIRPHEAYAASKLLFDLAGVKYRQAEFQGQKEV